MVGGTMAAKTGDAPSRAWALGEWSALLARAPTPPASDPQSLDQLARVESQAAVLQRLLEARRAEEVARNLAARELAYLNGKKADLMPQQAKLTLQQETLRRQQRATPEQAEQRRLRRLRAEASVKLEDVQQELRRYDRSAEALRATIARAERAIVDNEVEAAAQRAQLAAEQSEAPTLASYVAPLVHRLALGSVQFFLGQAPERAAAFAQNRREVADDLLALFGEISRGRFRQSDVDAISGGRAPLVGEVMWSLLAIGDESRIATLFDKLSPLPFSHQIYPVFRAFVPGLFVAGRTRELAEALAAHRYVQGVRGATAEAMWRFMEGNAQAYFDALKTLPVYDWRQGHGPGAEGWGLVSTTAAGLARLGHERSWPVPQAALALTAPPDLWRHHARDKGPLGPLSP